MIRHRRKPREPTGLRPPRPRPVLPPAAPERGIRPPRTAALLGCVLALTATPGRADSKVAPEISPPCARAEADLARVADLPFDANFTHKGDLTVEAFDHANDLVRSEECNCAVAETVLLRTASAQGQIPDPATEELRKLPLAVLDLPVCRQPPDLVLALDDCLAPEIRGTLESNLADTLTGITDERVKALLGDAVLRARCVPVGARQATRLGVWRKPYGNRDVLPETLGTSGREGENLALHLTSAALRQLLVDLAPTLQELVEEYLLNLETRDARSLHLALDGRATPGDGAAEVRIDADLRLLRFETSLFEIGLAITDTLTIETEAERRAAMLAAYAASGRIDIPWPDRSALRCATRAEAVRGLDAARVFLALFVVPTFGPGVAGGIEWLSSDRLDDALADAGISGAVCALVDHLPARQPTAATGVATLAISRAEADNAGVHLYGAFGLEAKEPVAWITRPLTPSSPAGTPPLAGYWLAADSRDLFEPTYAWTLVSGADITDPGLAAAACGAQVRTLEQGGEASRWKCVVPPQDRALWVEVTARDADGVTVAHARHFRDATQTLFCSDWTPRDPATGEELPDQPACSNVP